LHNRSTLARDAISSVTKLRRVSPVHFTSQRFAGYRSFNQTVKTSMNTQEFRVAGDDLLERIKSIVREGNARHIVLKNSDGVTVAEFPLSIGVIGAVVTPMIAAVGAVAALAAQWTIVVEKNEDEVVEEKEVPIS
jgi:hypothetical protein